MTETKSGKLPICLATGFLGSGKTTLLKQIVAQNRERKLVYIVNEFSPHDIDGSIVSSENPDVVSIPGGSIFCKCLVTEFIGQLSTIPDSFDGVEGVIIEASGMADPKVIADMLTETGLDSRYRLAHIISIVDPGSFLKLRMVLPNIISQIEAAHTVFVNKIDIHDKAVVADTVKAIQEINPDATIHKTVNAEAAIDLFPAENTATSDLHGDYAKCKDPNYTTITVKVAHTPDPNILREHILAVEDELYRIKGPLLTTEGPRFLEYTKSGLTLSPIPDAGDRTLVLIMHGNPSQKLQHFTNWLQASGKNL